MPEPDWNRGSLARACRATTELLRLLADDARVKTAFQQWGAERGITPHRFERAWQGNATARQELLIAARLAPEPAVATLDAFARDELHLPYQWVPYALVVMFRLWVDDFIAQRPRRIPSFHPNEPSLPRGRGPRDTLPRDVEWFYRARVKEPCDSLAAILRDEQRANLQLSSNHSLIAQGIARVHDWLDHSLIAIDESEP